MNQPPESPETSVSAESYDIENAESSLPWWKSSGRALLGLGVFAVLSTGIVGATHMLSSSAMEGHDMGGHGGHDMGAVSYTHLTLPTIYSV